MLRGGMVGDNDGDDDDDDDDEDEQEVVVWLLRGRMAEQRATIFTSSPGAGLAWLLTCYHLHSIILTITTTIISIITNIMFIHNHTR